MFPSWSLGTSEKKSVNYFCCFVKDAVFSIADLRKYRHVEPGSKEGAGSS